VTPGDDRVYGLKGVIRLVRQFMTREERGGALRSIDCPVLVVEGFRGTGKSAVLAKLDSLLEHVPHARLNLERLDTDERASVPKILSAIAFDLSKRYPKYELRFPRFIVGQLAARQSQLDLTNHDKACRDLEAALREHRNFDAIREVLVKTAGTVLRGVGGPIKPPDSLLRAGVNWFAGHAPGRAIALGSYQKWYGHQDLGLDRHPTDVLVELNSWAQHPDEEGNQRKLDALLLSAFLADLRSEFDRGRRADERSLNCVVLLDNGDTDLGRRFLGQLVSTRRQRKVDQDDPDPLTVVVTSRGGLLADVPEADRSSVAPAELHAAQTFDVDELSRYWWLGLRLPDLTRDEVARAATDMGIAWGSNQRLVRIVHDLTGGHPAATSLVLGAVAHGSPRKWVDPEEILARLDRSTDGNADTSADADEDPVTVERRILDRLLTGESDAARRNLVSCAPAREHAHALALAGPDGILADGKVSYETIDRLLWPAKDSAGRTLLRRLLTRRLAERPDSPDWSAVHGKLRQICKSGGDETGELYYALADDALGYVATRLHELLSEVDSEAWYELVGSISQAPHRERPRVAPIDEVRAVVDSTGLEPPVRSIARLVAALHIAADPLTDSRRRDLHLQIANDYGEVAQICPGGPHVVFLEAARRHRKDAEWWD
jgi:hypothetical protein